MIKKGRENIHVVSNSRIHTTCWNTATRAQARTRCVGCENIPMISYSRIHTTYWHPAHTYHLLTHCTHTQPTDTLRTCPSTERDMYRWEYTYEIIYLNTHTTYWHPTPTYHLLAPYTHIPLEIYIRHHPVEYMHQTSSVGCENVRTISYSSMHTTYWHPTHVLRHRRRCP